MKQAGLKLIFEPSAVTWHFCAPTGGIRDGQRENLGISDERIFQKKLKEWGVVTPDISMCVLNGGIGDHFAFKANMDSYFKVNEGKKKILFVVYPEVFQEYDNIQLASIADAFTFFGNIEAFDIYKWCWEHNWTKGLVEAYQARYSLEPLPLRVPTFGLLNSSKDVIISPYSQSPDHPKSYPYWSQLVTRFNDLGLNTIQIGRTGEQMIDGVKQFIANPKFKQIETYIRDCKFWISSDTFLPHLVNCMQNPVKGVVLFSQSDPALFGYDYNINLLRSPKYLRKYQYQWWKDPSKNEYVISKKNGAFCDPEYVITKIEHLLK